MRMDTRKKAPTLFDFVGEVSAVLDRDHTWWRDCFDGDDVAEWLAQRWPLRNLDAEVAAGQCLADLEETLFDAIAES